MKSIGTLLILSGFIVVMVGVLFFFGGSVPLVGKLPGDIRISRPGLTFYMPITTCIVLSIAISFLFFILKFFR